MEKYG